MYAYSKIVCAIVYRQRAVGPQLKAGEDSYRPVIMYAPGNARLGGEMPLIFIGADVIRECMKRLY